MDALQKMINCVLKNTFRELKDAKHYIYLAKDAKELGQVATASDFKSIANDELKHYDANRKILNMLLPPEQKENIFYEMNMQELADMYDDVVKHLSQI